MHPEDFVSPEAIAYLQSVAVAFIAIVILIAFGVILYRLSTKRCKTGLADPIKPEDCVGRDYVNQQATMYDYEEDRPREKPDCPPCFCAKHKKGDEPPAEVVDALCDGTNPDLIQKCLRHFLDKVVEQEGDSVEIIVTGSGEVKVEGSQGTTYTDLHDVVRVYFEDKFSLASD